GVGALAPAVARARAYGRGAFVLALTTNPEAAATQRAVGPDGRSVAQRVVDEIAQLNQGDAEVTEGPAAGSFGVVIGATVAAGGCDLSRLTGPVLVPGLGAQGASAADLRAGFGADLSALLPSYSRQVLAAGPGVAGLRAAAQRALDDCKRVLMAAA